MVVVGAVLLAFALAEIGEHVFVAPTLVAELAPMVVVLALAADIDEPLIDDEPPSTLPRGCLMLRPPVAASGSDV